MQRSLDVLVLPAFDDLADLLSEYAPWQRAYDLTNTYEHSGYTRARTGAPPLVTEMEDAGTAIALDRYGLLDSYLSIRGVANPDRGAMGDGDESFDESFKAGFGVAVENATAVRMALVDERSG